MSDIFDGNAPAVSFEKIGESYTLVITEPPSLVQGRVYNTETPATWPDGNPKMSAVVKGTLQNGDTVSIWATKPSAKFAALVEAQRTSGLKIEPGNILTITYTGDKPAKKGYNPAKLYSATLTKGTAPVTTDEPPF